jgi:hypothetical protein
MSVVVFVGPTVDRTTVLSHIDAIVRGPVSCGEVYEVSRHKPSAIAIVDGYFDRVPSVWHKEILWAMAEGIPVFGASSMGALRAAELSQFGMVGVGAIYEAYHNGELEDDDEVAVAHGPVEAEFRAASEAMVNVRATLRAADASQVIGPETASRLVALAKARFYADRSYAALLKDAEMAGLNSVELGRLRGWLPVGRVDQKRADALELIGYIRDWMRGARATKPVTYHFHSTDAWHALTRLVASWRQTPGGAARTDDSAVLEELKICGMYPRAWPAAALRSVALQQSVQASAHPDPVAVQEAAVSLRRRLGLYLPSDFERWRTGEQLSTADALRLLEDEARLAWAEPLIDELARLQLIDYLRSQGEFGHLASRAEAKARCLSRHGSITPSLVELSMTESALWAWYFGERLGREIPENVDNYARTIGFRCCDEFRAAVIRELVFAGEAGGGTTGSPLRVEISQLPGQGSEPVGK